MKAFKVIPAAALAALLSGCGVTGADCASEASKEGNNPIPVH